MTAKTEKTKNMLILGALGIVFGDIGTSPLYAMQAIFGQAGLKLQINTLNVYGILSLIVWAVILVVGVKYIGFIMRADNKGEGGILALVARIKSTDHIPRKLVLIILGLIGVSLFYGDSTITPAISVLSAVEGLKVVAPSLTSYVLPITILIIIVLFWLQKYGTATIGRIFGPVMVVWFLLIGLGGLRQIVMHPDILHALSPVAAVQFIGEHHTLAIVSLGAVVLAITGAEALYADMGHFGRRPIAKAWFFFVFPALVLCYLGQGALLLHSGGGVTNSFILLFPSVIRIFVLVWAVLATIIASQAVISGAFSITKQAVELGFLPKMYIRHTSAVTTGQIYIPSINIGLFAVVTALVLSFGSSERLASAYGIAVSGTLAIDSILFVAVMYYAWRKSVTYVFAIGATFLLVDIAFLAGNLPKVLHGGWFPITLAVIVFIVLYTWSRGQQVVVKKRQQLQQPIDAFIDKLNTKRLIISRVPGEAVFIGRHEKLVPLAMLATVNELHELPKKSLILTVKNEPVAHVAERDRYIYDALKYNDGISHLILSYGYKDIINVPHALEAIAGTYPELDINFETAAYFVSETKLVVGKKSNLYRWQKTLYSLLARNALSYSDYFKLPANRTVEMGTVIEI